MLANYATTAVRQLTRRKLYTALNIGGFALGLACVLLIGLFVRHETSYDDHFRDADRIYRISADYDPAAMGTFARVAANVLPAGPALLEDFPTEVEQFARIWGERVRLTRGTDILYEDGFRWADASFFELFDFEWLRGDPERALAGPANVVLTESMAAKYFGDEDPVGQTLLLETKWPLTVTGVIRDLPSDTHLTATAIASFDSGFNVLGWNPGNNWSFWRFHTYVRLRAGASIEAIEQRLDDFLARHKRPGDVVTGMTATKLTDIHLRANRTAELGTPGDAATVATFAAIALFVLLIACINFTNLATARAATRAREVGVRKVLGAGRRALVVQFLGEALLLAAIAMTLAVAIVELLLPWFNAYLGRELTFDYLADPKLAAALVAFTVLCAAIAGAYPALYLSAFESARVLAGDLTRGKGGIRLRRALVVTQFAVAITLIIATAVFRQQLAFARNVDRGFQTERIVVVAGSDANRLGAEWQALEQRLLEHPEITHVTAGSMWPRIAGPWQIRVEDGEPRGLQLPTIMVDYGFFATYGVDLVAGRVFSAERGTDEFVFPDTPGGSVRTTGAYVLNELAVRTLGWTPDGALGKWLEIDFSSDFTRTVRGPVIGVVADTFIDSVREPRQPIVYFKPPLIRGDQPTFEEGTVRVTGARFAETLEFIDAAWTEVFPDLPVTRFFLDDAYAALDADDERRAQMLAAFASLAIVVACLGLIGLAALTTEQRTKEIGVRKALGGTLPDIVGLFAAEFAKLVLVASLVAWPMAYVVTQRWLAGFAYRIELSYLVFAGSAALALLLACVTVGAIAACAASAKPMTALRHE